jgi:hypothetical protein
MKTLELTLKKKKLMRELKLLCLSDIPCVVEAHAVPGYLNFN